VHRQTQEFVDRFIGFDHLRPRINDGIVLSLKGAKERGSTIDLLALLVLIIVAVTVVLIAADIDAHSAERIIWLRHSSERSDVLKKGSDQSIRRAAASHALTAPRNTHKI
jgi:hypothetical protein